ncbi:hypothetical protein AC578_11132 [Pseudocercospora eumusae]|uniref:Uncharacterized protein n=1 Tax=Pseudocercospora eumusae TaxID=321146 RepID=A0A139H297_9PEZI|nr:hypothetical protein AC578_11132 [Pseudocercospora eumusae]
MPLFPWIDAAKEVKRLLRRSIDFGQLQDQIDGHRDRVTRLRRSVCPSPEKISRIVDVPQPTCSMSAFVAINRTQQKPHDLTATASSKQKELPERKPRTSEPKPHNKSEPTSATSITKEQSNASSSVESSHGKREETEQKEQAQNPEKSQSFGGQTEDSESDEDPVPRRRLRQRRGQCSRSSADEASASEETCAPPRRLRRPRRLPRSRQTTSPSPAPTCTPPVRLEDRNWAVLGIAGVQKLNNITRYLAIWGNTTHRLPTLQANANGVYSIEVDGRICEIEALGTPRVHGDTTELEVEVRWRSEWLYTWELSDARRELVEFNAQRASGPVTDPDRLATYHSPEREADTTKRGHIDFVPKLKFTPQPDKDYTASLMWRCIDRCEQGTNHDKLSDNFIRACLDELPRQRLVLRTEWRIDPSSADYIDVLECREEVLLRAFLNYVVGQARRIRCSYCAKRCGPLRRCVTRGTNYEGACASCGLAGRSRQCEYYFKGFWAIEDKMRAATGAQNADSRSEVNEDADVDMEEDLYSPSTLPAPGPQIQHANRSAFLTPPTSSPPQGLFAGAANAGASVQPIVDAVSGDNPSASLGNDATLHNTNGSEGVLSQPNSDASRVRSEEVRRTADPNKEKKAIKRKRSSSAIGPPRRVPPSRQHKVARTVEHGDGDCSHRPSAPRESPHSQPPSHCDAGSSAPQEAGSTAEQGHAPDPQAQLTHQTDHQRHATCSPRGPCIDPVLNPPLPKTDVEPPVVIYRDRDQLFSKSELTDAEVRYLLSVAPCQMIDAVIQWWHALQPEWTKHDCMAQYTKEWYLSRHWTRELNQIVRERCPPDPSRLGNPVMIDLTLGDD